MDGRSGDCERDATEVGGRGSPLGPTLSRPGAERATTFFFVFVCLDFLFYLESQVVIRRSTFASKKEINFFQVFHCTIYLRKETFS